MIDILMFHRILPKKEIDTNDAYFIRGTLISVERLEEVVKDYLKNNFIFKTVGDIDHNSKHKQVVLTFDDGHIDHFLYALPVLEKYCVKSTFYPVITYCKEQKIAPLDIYYHYVNNHIELAEKDEWITGAKKQNFLAMSTQEQRLFAEKLPQTSTNSLTYMTGENLQELQGLGHQIGGHSLYHDIYTQMSLKEIEEDVQKTIAEFAQLGISITSYAYPNGDYNLDAINVLQKHHIETACVIRSQNLTASSNYELERRFVKENEII